jgi:hypothetical protein
VQGELQGCVPSVRSVSFSNDADGMVESTVRLSACYRASPASAHAKRGSGIVASHDASTSLTIPYSLLDANGPRGSTIPMMGLVSAGE